MSTSVKKSKVLLLSLVIASDLLLLGCEGSNSITNKPASINIVGKIDPERITELSGKPVTNLSGIQIMLTRMNQDGSIDRISKETVHPDEAGNFTLQTDTIDLEYAIIVAKHNEQEWKTVIDQPFKLGDTIRLSPITDETTIETEVYNRLHLNQRGNTPDFSTVQHFVDTDLAESIRGNAVKIAALAGAIRRDQNQSWTGTTSTIPVSQAAMDKRNKPAFSARIDGDINLSEDSRATLDELVRSLDRSNRKIHLELHVIKAMNKTVSREKVEGGLDSNQNQLWEQLKQQIVYSVKSDKKSEISFEIRLQLNA